MALYALNYALSAPRAHQFRALLVTLSNQTAIAYRWLLAGELINNERLVRCGCAQRISSM